MMSDQKQTLSPFHGAHVLKKYSGTSPDTKIRVIRFFWGVTLGK